MNDFLIGIKKQTGHGANCPSSLIHKKKVMTRKLQHFEGTLSEKVDHARIVHVGKGMLDNCAGMDGQINSKTVSKPPAPRENFFPASGL